MSEAIATIEQSAMPLALRPEIYMAPPISVKAAVERYTQFQELVSKLLIPMDPAKNGSDFAGADYGMLPGTKNRCLFQPGAEKLAMFFGLEVNVYCRSKTEEWSTPENPRLAFFKYEFEAVAKYNGHTICNVIRSCSVREDKYAWIWVNTRKIPSEDEVIEMEQIEAGRWVAGWKETGFKPRKAEADALKAQGKGRWKKVGDEYVWLEKGERVWQEKRPNPNPAAIQFVVEAMAQKRAYVACVKKALAATGYFAAEADFSDLISEIHEKVVSPPDEINNPAPPKKGDSGKLRQEQAGAKTPGGRALIALKDASQMPDTEFLALVETQCGVSATNPVEAADEISEREQQIVSDMLRERLKSSAK